MSTPATAEPVHLVLASASPARLATLRSAGVHPRVVVSAVDEDATLAEAVQRYGPLEPADAALVLARAKSENVAAGLVGDALVLGCDSVLELDGEIHGKPGTSDVARERWARMSGRTGILHTGHWLIDARDPGGRGTGATFGATGSTLVRFATLDPAEIDGYVATGEPLLVAGAFTLDGLGGPYVDSIDGDPHNVVGVSLPLLRGLLGELGLPFSRLRS